MATRLKTASRNPSWAAKTAQPVATAWEGGAVAATEHKQLGSVGGAVLLAALALPGLSPTTARAENPPERASIAFKYLGYKDKQPGVDRIKVRAPSVEVVAPMGSEWSMSVSAVNDVVSGASPRRYSDVTSGASKMTDNRTGIDGSVTYYRPLSAYSFSLSNSKEHDYVSRAGGFNARFSSDDHNTTFNVGMGLSSDKIGQTGHPEVDTRKHTNEYLIGVTQSLTRTDIVQFNVGFNVGRGDYIDHYKSDLRPDRREELTQLVRWNHHFETLGSSLRFSYRHYSDSWDLRSHTVQAEWVQPVNDQITLTPLLRYYTQNAASFYVDPKPGTYKVPTVADGEPFTPDQRLSAFGAVTLGLRADYQFDKDWSTDLRGDWYKQRSDWRMGGNGSPGLVPFQAVSVQWGLKRAF
jgi:hypothetical protein